MANYTIQFKRGKAASWEALNLILNPGEPGFEIDTGRMKVGNGTDAWNDLPYVGEHKELIIDASTRDDFPTIGDAKILYKASQERQLYQWNEVSSQYEVLIRNDYVTLTQLQDILSKIEIPEMALEDYATKAYAQELFGKMIPLEKVEILEICN